MNNEYVKMPWKRENGPLRRTYKREQKTGRTIVMGDRHYDEEVLQAKLGEIMDPLEDGGDKK